MYRTDENDKHDTESNTDKMVIKPPNDKTVAEPTISSEKTMTCKIPVTVFKVPMSVKTSRALWSVENEDFRKPAKVCRSLTSSKVSSVSKNDVTFGIDRDCVSAGIVGSNVLARNDARGQDGDCNVLRALDKHGNLEAIPVVDLNMVKEPLSGRQSCEKHLIALRSAPVKVLRIQPVAVASASPVVKTAVAAPLESVQVIAGSSNDEPVNCSKDDVCGEMETSNEFRSSATVSETDIDGVETSTDVHNKSVNPPGSRSDDILSKFPPDAPINKISGCTPSSRERLKTDNIFDAINVMYDTGPVSDVHAIDLHVTSNDVGILSKLEKPECSASSRCVDDVGGDVKNGGGGYDRKDSDGFDSDSPSEEDCWSSDDEGEGCNGENDRLPVVAVDSRCANILKTLRRGETDKLQSTMCASTSSAPDSVSALHGYVSYVGNDLRAATSDTILNVVKNVEYQKKSTTVPLNNNEPQNTLPGLGTGSEGLGTRPRSDVIVNTSNCTSCDSVNNHPTDQRTSELNTGKLDYCVRLCRMSLRTSPSGNETKFDTSQLKSCDAIKSVSCTESSLSESGSGISSSPVESLFHQRRCANVRPPSKERSKADQCVVTLCDIGASKKKSVVTSDCTLNRNKCATSTAPLLRVRKERLSVTAASLDDARTNINKEQRSLLEHSGVLVKCICVQSSGTLSRANQAGAVETSSCEAYDADQSDIESVRSAAPADYSARPNSANVLQAQRGVDYDRHRSVTSEDGSVITSSSRDENCDSAFGLGTVDIGALNKESRNGSELEAASDELPVIKAGHNTRSVTVRTWDKRKQMPLARDRTVAIGIINPHADISGLCSGQSSLSTGQKFSDHSFSSQINTSVETSFSKTMLSNVRRTSLASPSTREIKGIISKMKACRSRSVVSDVSDSNRSSPETDLDGNELWLRNSSCIELGVFKMCGTTRDKTIAKANDHGGSQHEEMAGREVKLSAQFIASALAVPFVDMDMAGQKVPPKRCDVESERLTLSETYIGGTERDSRERKLASEKSTLKCVGVKRMPRFKLLSGLRDIGCGVQPIVTDKELSLAASVRSVANIDDPNSGILRNLQSKDITPCPSCGDSDSDVQNDDHDELDCYAHRVGTSTPTKAGNVLLDISFVSSISASSRMPDAQILDLPKKKKNGFNEDGGRGSCIDNTNTESEVPLGKYFLAPSVAKRRLVTGIAETEYRKVVSLSRGDLHYYQTSSSKRLKIKEAKLLAKTRINLNGSGSLDAPTGSVDHGSKFGTLSEMANNVTVGRQSVRANSSAIDRDNDRSFASPLKRRNIIKYIDRLDLQDKSFGKSAFCAVSQKVNSSTATISTSKVEKLKPITRNSSSLTSSPDISVNAGCLRQKLAKEPSTKRNVFAISVQACSKTSRANVRLSAIASLLESPTVRSAVSAARGACLKRNFSHSNDSLNESETSINAGDISPVRRSASNVSSSSRVSVPCLGPKLCRKTFCCICIGM